MVLAIAYIIVVVWLSVATLSRGQTQIVVCPCKLLYHIPCPGCGVTRATILAFKGDFCGALRLNPNVILSVLFLVGYPILVLFDLMTGKSQLNYIYALINDVFKKKAALVIVLVIELIIWIHNIYIGI